MPRKFILLVSLVLTLGFGITTSVTAQETPAAEMPQLEGLESGYARMFMPDFNAMFEAMGTPGANIPELDEKGVLTIMTAVLTFDSTDNAGKGLDSTADAFTRQDGGTDLTSSEIKDLGDKAMLYSGEADAGDGTTMLTNVLVVQDSERVYMVMVAGGELEAGATQAKDIARFMLDARPTTPEVTLKQDGTSTGGAFDRMPTAKDTDLVSGLAPFMDVDMKADPASLGN